MNKIERQNARDAKVEDLLVKVDFLVEIVTQLIKDGSKKEKEPKKASKK